MTVIWLILWLIAWLFGDTPTLTVFNLWGISLVACAAIDIINNVNK